MEKIIYLDSHSTTPVDKKVLDIMIPFFSEQFGNSGSIDHMYGNFALSQVNKARKEIANIINGSEDEIIFTSGATESNNLALLGIMDDLNNKHIITSVVEHKSILSTCKFLESKGCNVTYLKVDKNGFIDLIELEEAINKNTVLISIMAANNEIGTISRLEEIGKIAKKHNVLFHTDAAQAYTNIDLDVESMNIDLMSISGHKIYGPKGIGCLFVKRGVKLSTQIHGGGQENNMRSGTLNVPGIVGLAEAAIIAKDYNTNEIKKLRDKLFDNLKKSIDIEINGPPFEKRLSHNLNIYVKGIDAKALLNEVKNKIAISAGSACTAKDVKPSYVIEALGYDDQRAFSSIRIGLCKDTNEKDIEIASQSIIEAVKKLQRFSI